MASADCEDCAPRLRCRMLENSSMKVSGAWPRDQCAGKAVVGDHRRNGREQAHGSRHQRFGNAGATVARVTCSMAKPVRRASCPKRCQTGRRKGETEPTGAKTTGWTPPSSISRWKLARMARRRRPAACRPSVMRRSRSFGIRACRWQNTLHGAARSWRSARRWQTGHSGWCPTRTRAQTPR